MIQCSQIVVSPGLLFGQYAMISLSDGFSNLCSEECVEGCDFMFCSRWVALSKTRKALMLCFPAVHKLLLLLWRGIC